MLAKYDARHVKRKISRVLWEVWDPIGVNDLGGPRDEYDGYVNMVYKLLTSNASDDAIAVHLLEVASETMGLSGVRVGDIQSTVAAPRKIRIVAEAG